MYIPNAQNIFFSALAFTGLYSSELIDAEKLLTVEEGGKVASGSVMDYAVEKCLDEDGNVRCTKPFMLKKSTCYNLEWHTDGKISHTTAEIRDAGSNELVYYRDTNGDWTAEKNEVSLNQLIATDTQARLPRLHAQGSPPGQQDCRLCCQALRVGRLRRSSLFVCR